MREEGMRLWEDDKISAKLDPYEYDIHTTIVCHHYNAQIQMTQSNENWPITKDCDRDYEYYKEHEHTIKECWHLKYLVEKMIQARLLKQYVCKCRVCQLSSDKWQGC